ncbi:DUF1279 super [Dispira simplex]|nr:DUF1279 super [Dispira simplex]
MLRFTKLPFRNTYPFLGGSRFPCVQPMVFPMPVPRATLYTLPWRASPIRPPSRHMGLIRSYSQSPTVSPSNPTPKKRLTFRELFHKYGKVATLVYLGICAIDLSLCVWLVYVAGEEKVKAIENWALDRFGDWLPLSKSTIERMITTSESSSDQNNSDSDTTIATHQQGPSWMSTFLIGYSFHKLLTPIRLPLTVLITPSIARKLRSLGYFLPKK